MASAATFTVNVRGSLAGSKSTPCPATQTRERRRPDFPAAVMVVVWPRLAPAGKSQLSSGGVAIAWPPEERQGERETGRQGVSRLSKAPSTVGLNVNQPVTWLWRAGRPGPLLPRSSHPINSLIGVGSLTRCVGPALRRVEDLAGVDAELGVDGRGEILGREDSLHRRRSLAVGRADDLAAGRAAAGEHHRHGVGPVVAARRFGPAACDLGRAAEFARATTSVVSSKPALVEVLDQGGDGEFERRQLLRQSSKMLGVVVPAAVVERDERHAGLDQPPGQQSRWPNGLRP